MLLYFGPEIMMPLASAAAAALGGILMFWRRVVAALKASWRFITGRSALPAEGASSVDDTGPPGGRPRRRSGEER